MFDYKISPFGAYEKHSFLNELTGSGFDVVPQYGACLLDLRFDGVGILDGYESPEAMTSKKWAKSAILAPFPNRLKDGRYKRLGKEYQFPINNPDSNNAIHGFLIDAEMQVTHNAAGSQARLCCAYEHDGRHSGYPFPFHYEIDFTLLLNTFMVEMRFRNEGEGAIPAGLGWHPYFHVADLIDTLSIQLPECKKIETDRRMLPTGAKVAFNDFKKLRPLGPLKLDTGFMITGDQKRAETILQSELGKLTFWQETGAAKWNFLQIFTPPHRRSIAIEPMTCNIDAFNNGEGLALLHSGATLEGKFGIIWEGF